MAGDDSGILLFDWITIKTRRIKMATDTMELWNKVCETDPAITKNYKGKGGFQGTSACAQSQRKRATELWGPIGGEWGVRNGEFTVVERSADPHDSLLVFMGEFYCPAGKIDIVSSKDLWSYSHTYKNWSPSNDPYKKVKTDAMTKGMSEFGFNSDLFEGKFDDNKYVEEMREKFANAPAQEPAPKAQPKTEPEQPPSPEADTDLAPNTLHGYLKDNAKYVALFKDEYIPKILKRAGTKKDIAPFHAWCEDVMKCNLRSVAAWDAEVITKCRVKLKGIKEKTT